MNAKVRPRVRIIIVTIQVKAQSYNPQEFVVKAQRFFPAILLWSFSPTEGKEEEEEEEEELKATGCSFWRFDARLRDITEKQEKRHEA